MVTAFEIGENHGCLTGVLCTYAEARDRFPEVSEEFIHDYLAGRDAAVFARQPARINQPRQPGLLAQLRAYL